MRETKQIRRWREEAEDVPDDQLVSFWLGKQAEAQRKAAYWLLASAFFGLATILIMVLL